MLRTENRRAQPESSIEKEEARIIVPARRGGEEGVGRDTIAPSEDIELAVGCSKAHLNAS